MTDDTALPQPTVTSNTQAARLACNTERERVLKLLAMAPEGSVPEPLLQAIANGTPAAVFASSQRVRAGKATSDTGKPAAQSTGAGGSKWGGITSRLNAQRRAAGESTDAEGSAA
jgi:hypothetical protein